MRKSVSYLIAFLAILAVSSCDFKFEELRQNRDLMATIFSSAILLVLLLLAALLTMFIEKKSHKDEGGDGI